jgi:simple sugar transport system substrate-binding protein/basic membrane protein A
MYAALGQEVKAGHFSGDFKAYGYNTQPVTGAVLRQSAERAFNPAVPQAVIDELEATAKRFASGELKVVPTREDAKGGK